jgi:phenylacetic acid degradation operon negative regulatory protein
MEFDERPPVRTQFLVFTLFGDYVVPRGGTIWTSSLIDLLELLDVSERAARSTLSRMARKGWISASKHGRRSQYSLTARGWMLITQGEQRIFEPAFSNWDGLWHLVVYSLPERKRRLRHSLRKGLAWLGYGSLAPGTWISPHSRKVEVKNLCNDLGVNKYVEIFSGTHLGLTMDREMVQRCWDLNDLAKQYHKFIARYEKGYLECKNGAEVPSDACFVRRFWLTHDFQSFPLTDPNLPISLLAPDWIGFKARGMFDDYRRMLEARANAFVDKVVGKTKGGLTRGQINEIVRRSESYRVPEDGQLSA